MALNYQNSTLSMTLPISCQICLGKVKQPVICANYHVFCSSCMEMWLKKASQCPTCRVPITAESPCREIIGGTNESDHTESVSVKKCLRKTRGELLLREYEGEIDGLIRENEELNTKNQTLEAQLKTVLDPSYMNPVQAGERGVDPCVLEEWKNRLRAATDVCDKVKQDMDKLKEANKALRSQNIDLVQENMRLKAEVASRSPQKFGRYTVAALEAKIQLYERDADHLKKALERSDQYIEDLESQIRKSEKRGGEVQEASGGGGGGGGKTRSDALTQQQKISMMMRSLSDNERALICSNPETESRASPRTPGLVSVPPADHKDFGKSLAAEKRTEDLELGSPDHLPTTPSSAFRSLTLRSPGLREKKVAFKPGSYLRRLDFEDFPSLGKTDCNAESGFPEDLPPNPTGDPSNSVLWGGWQRSNSDQQPGPSSEISGGGSLSVTSDEEPGGLQISSEASMDAAFLDKISELDSMMLDGESSSSRGSQLSLVPSPRPNLDNTLVPEPQSCKDVSASADGVQNLQSRGDASADGAALAEESFAARVSDGESRVHGVFEDGRTSQTDELSFDLLFDSLEDSKTGPSGSMSPPSRDHANSSSVFSCNGKPANAARDKQPPVMGQPTKRKSHSPFSTSSPTKLSKLM